MAQGKLKCIWHKRETQAWVFLSDHLNNCQAQQGILWSLEIIHYLESFICSYPRKKPSVTCPASSTLSGLQLFSKPQQNQKQTKNDRRANLSKYSWPFSCIIQQEEINLCYILPRHLQTNVLETEVKYYTSPRSFKLSPKFHVIMVFIFPVTSSPGKNSPGNKPG